MALINQIYFASIILVSFLVFNMMSKDLLRHVLSVRMSKGKKVLVHVKGLEQWYYSSGELIDNHLRYKDKDKRKKSLILDNRNLVGRAFNLPMIITDSVTNSIMQPDFTAVEGFDSKSVDNIIVRALTAPTVEDQRIRLIAAVLAIAVILFMGYFAFRAFPELVAKVDQIGIMLQGMTQVA